ncbi:hypothetical protein P353_25780 [Comamonas testosteroni]|uniref:Uncharacterized protein n=1 Tax=Comamonas testosteroni TaxID=285 RepID=A0A096GJH0_COMTE|nr:hypothetical protein P353_25780 [Comamonas testosteroni]
MDMEDDGVTISLASAWRGHDLLMGMLEAHGWGAWSRRPISAKEAREYGGLQAGRAWQGKARQGKAYEG